MGWVFGFFVVVVMVFVGVFCLFVLTGGFLEASKVMRSSDKS